MDIDNNLDPDFWSASPRCHLRGETKVNIKTTLKTSVAAAALVALGAPAIVTSAEAGVNNGNKNGLVMSGQIVRALFYQDNGNQSQLFNGDGVNTRSRIRWIVSGQMTESVAIGGLVEMNFPNSNANGALGTASETNTDTTWQVRHSRVDFKHKTLGTLSIGQSSVAGDGAVTQTLASQTPLHSASGAELMRASTFFNNTTQALSTVGSGSLGGYDPSREDRVRYDTPSFGGLKAAVSWQGTGEGSVGLNYGGKFGSVQVAAAAMYRGRAAAATDQDATYGGSLAVKHDSGIAGQVGYSAEEAATGIAVEGEAWHVGLGYATSLNNLGTTSFDLTYAVSQESVSNNDEGEAWAVSVNQKVSSVGLDLYAGAMLASYDDGTAGSNYEDFTTIFAGTKLNF